VDVRLPGEGVEVEQLCGEVGDELGGGDMGDELAREEQLERRIEVDDELEGCQTCKELCKDYCDGDCPEVCHKKCSTNWSSVIPSVCSWPSLHADIRSYKFTSSYRGVVMGQLVADPMRHGLRSGDSQIQASQLLGDEDIIDIVKKRCSHVVEYLHTHLKDEVYDEVDLEMIQNSRVVLDLEAKLDMVKTQGPIQAGQQTFGEFYKAAKFLDASLEAKCDKDEFKDQYKLHMKRLQGIVELKNSEKLSSMDIIVLLMNTEAERYRGTEAVIDILYRAAVSKSVESVVESWISVLEHHSSKVVDVGLTSYISELVQVRGLKDESIQRELMIAVNGPPLQLSDQLIKESMQVSTVCNVLMFSYLKFEISSPQYLLMFNV
jgi:hypothetical protein